MSPIQQKPILHGRDHLAGGPDPIPGIGSVFSGGQMAAYPGHRLGATEDRWYGSRITSEVTVVGTPSANVLRCSPFIGSRDMTIDRIAVLVTAGSAGNARLGIYDDDGNLYPNNLLVDSGALSTAATAPLVATISQALTGGFLYWLALVANSGSVQYDYLPGSSQPALLGFPVALDGTGAGIGWTKAFTYAALPDPFPSAGSVLAASASMPAIYVRGT